jgi:penicillin V acylase-like amidase (Ntn superfamily)
MRLKAFYSFVLIGLVLFGFSIADACSIFAVKNNNNAVFVGRNFDWIGQGGQIHFFPSTRVYGTATKGFCIIEQMGVDRPYEGMNTEGLFVAMAAVISQPEKTNRDKTTFEMNDLGLLRFILERASSSGEALLIAEKFKLDYMAEKGYPKVHYLFADAQGNVALYEEGVNSSLKKLDKTEWEAITNFSLAKRQKCNRYDRIKLVLESKYVGNAEQAKNLLTQVRQNTTVWSGVYDLSKKEFDICIEQDYNHTYTFNLEKELRMGYHSIDFAELKLPWCRIN